MKKWTQPLVGLALLGTPAAAQMDLDYLTSHGAPMDVALDGNGCLYVMGDGGNGQPIVTPPSLPCSPSGPAGSGTAWLTKLDTSGEIVWSRAVDSGRQFAVAVDTAGANVYVAGWAGSYFPSQFPSTGYDADSDSTRDGYLCHFDAATGCPISVTFYGDHTGDNVFPNAVTIDEATGDVHVVGYTSVIDFPMPTVLEGYVPSGGTSAFAVAFDASLQSRRYFVYLPGGSGYDSANGVAVDGTGIYVSGASESTDLTFSPLRIGPGGGRDAFAMKLSPDATSLLYATFIGGSNGECHRDNNGVPTERQGAVLALDPAGCVTLASWSNSNNFPTTGGSSSSGNEDVFVMKLNAAGGGPLYSTLVGGNKDDLGSGIARDDTTDKVYVIGATKSANFPTPGGLVTQHASAPSKYDAFLIELDDINGALLSGTFMGGSGEDSAYGGVVTDGVGNVYLSGQKSSGFQPAPTSTTFPTGYFAAKISFGPVLPTPGISVTPTSGLVTDEGGATDAFTVVLETAPTDPVSISVSSDDATEGQVIAGSALVFDGTNWDQPQTVTVMGQGDTDPDGDVGYTLVTAEATSLDPDYNGRNAADVSATNLDDEVPVGITVSNITPGTMDTGSSVAVTVTGAGFLAGAALSFENGSGPAPSVSNLTVVSGSQITANLTVGGQGPKGTRTWDVRVTNADSSTGVLVDGFTVIK